jgi:hypothetical protein
MRGQVPPQAAAGFVERLFAGGQGQQQGVRPQVGRQRGHRVGQRRAGVNMQHRLIVAMQIEHDVGVDRHGQQGLFERVGVGRRDPGGDRVARMGAHQGHVGGGVVGEQATQGLFQVFGHMLVSAVEIHAGGQVEAAEGRALDRLRQADRIGGRDQHDLAADLARLFQRLELGAQELRHQHAWHFIGMQGALYIDFFAGTRGAVVKTGQRRRHAAAGGGEGMCV